MKVIRALFGMIQIAYRKTRLFLLVWITAIFFALVPLVNMFLFAAIIDSFAERRSFWIFCGLAVLYVAFKWAASGVHSFSGYIQQRLRQKTGLFMKERILTSLDTCSVAKFEDQEWYEKKLNRVLRISDCLSDELLSLSQLFGVMFSVISFFIYAFRYNWIIVVVGLTAMLVSILKSILTQKKRYQQSVEASHLFATYNRLYDDFFQIHASLEMRTFGAFPFVERVRKKRLAAIYDHRSVTKRRNSVVDFYFLAIHFGLYFILLYVLIFATDASPGLVVAMIPFSMSILGQLDGISLLMMSIVFSVKEWQEIEAFIREQADLSALDGHSTSCLVSPKDPAYVVEMSQVGFSYPHGKQALHDITLNIKEGEKVAFIGENGCGKSTLLKLLAGVFPAEHGMVFFNGEEFGEKSKETIGFVFQDIISYPLDFYHNVDASQCDVERIRELAGMVGLEYVKYEDPSMILYPGFYESINISGGEWQKVALIRMFYHYPDADVYVLDEPTAALDPISEVEVFRMFDRISNGRTLIYATHRLGIVKELDRIFVMQSGSIEAVGSHESLMKNCALYRDMVQAQAQWYEVQRV